MSEGTGLSPLQLTLITGTLLIANLAAFWFIRKNFFKVDHDHEKDKNKDEMINGKKELKRNIILDPEEWNEFELIGKKVITHNTAIYSFKLPTPESVLPLPIGQHVQLAAIWNGNESIRSYTPITLDDTKGHFDLLVKTYPQGNASQYLASLKIGDKARFRGPKGRFLYRPNFVKEVGLIAGGTGITPILQVIKAILRNPEDKTKISLIFGNLTKEDILLYEEIKELSANHSEQFRIHFVLNNPPEGGEAWNGSVGFINAEIIKAHCPAPSENSKILMCGPPPMMSAMIKILTEDLGFSPQSSPPSTDDQIQRF